MLLRICSFLCCFAVLLPSAAEAQFGPAGMLSAGNGSVVGTGTQTVERPVDTMRLTIVLSGKAKDLKTAIASLRDRQEAAQLQLESFGAKQDSITLGDTTVAKKSQQQIQMEAMLNQQRRAQGRAVPKGLQVPALVAVQSTLTAEWPLETDNANELLQFVTELQEKIKQADLAGVNEPSELSAAEQELAEEMASMSGRYGQEEGKPGEPSFALLGRINDEQKQAALKEAFAKAKAQAKQLAAAAGVELGALASLQGNVSALPSGQAGYDYGYYMRATGNTGKVSENESLSTELQSVSFTVTVVASFKLP